MKQLILVVCILLVVTASDHHHDDHVDPPGCMCLDCRAKRNEIVIPEGYVPDKAEFTVKDEWLKANPHKKVVELIPEHLSGLNNPNTPEGKAHLAQKAAEAAAAKAAEQKSAAANANKMVFLIHPDALEYFGFPVPKAGGKVTAEKTAEAPKKRIRCKKCGSYDCQ